MSKNTYPYEELDNIGISLYHLGNLIDVLAFAIDHIDEVGDKPSYVSSSLLQIGSRVDEIPVKGANDHE